MVNFLLRICIAVLGFGINNVVNAQVNTWTGDTDTDWHKACNWSMGSIPTNNDSIIIPNVTSTNYPVVTGNAQCRDLIITSTVTDALIINSTLGGEICVSSGGATCTNLPLTDNGGCPVEYLPNPSFENFTTCPTGISQYTVLEDWERVTSTGSPDYLNCGFDTAFGGAFLAPLKPFPDGTAVVGIFNYAINVPPFGNIDVHEFIGSCLVTPLTNGNDYTFEFEISAASNSAVSIDLTIFGTNDCANILPDIAIPPASTTSCPATIEPANFFALGSVTLTPSNSSWTSGSINFTAPSNVASVVIGGSCTTPLTVLTTDAERGYYYLDNFKLTDN